MTTVDQQQLLLLHQIQQHVLSTTHMYVLVLALGLPIPIAWKLAVYNFLVKLPIPPLSPLAFGILVIIGPWLSVALLFGLIWFGIWAIRSFIPFVLSKTPKKPVKQVMLELTFPADTSKSAYATEELYALLHSLARQKDPWSRMTRTKNEYSLELVSTKTEGIRFVVVVSERIADIIKRNLLSYLPGIRIREITDYLSSYLDLEKSYIGVEEFKLSGHFALPLETQKALTEHDPISYLTGNMTKLASHELVVFQVVTTPVISETHGRYVNEMHTLRKAMVKGEPLTPVLQKSPFAILASIPVISVIFAPLKFTLIVFWHILGFGLAMITAVVQDSHTAQSSPSLLVMNHQPNPQLILNPYEQELSMVVKDKIDQKLFETSIRLLVVAENKDEINARMNGLLASFGQLESTYQSLMTKSGILSPNLDKKLELFEKRTLSPDRDGQSNPILSTSELSDLFHFPYTDTTKTEDMVKVHSQDLPAPLSLKNRKNLDVVFGKNTYAGIKTPIGLTDADRSRHVYMIGQTGSGKSTIIYHMAKGDIEKGRGVAVIDPHGDLAEDLIASVPKSRINDCVYVNPFDLKYPIGINLLELTPGLDDDELELEKELVCESVVSTLRRIFTKDENTDAHRIEYILRNAIYTAFTVKDATIFTVYDLLNNPDFQKSVTKNLADENLKNFWKNEFGRAGNYQIVKMVSGVTARIGRFLFSPTAKRILEQSHSTVNFDDILASGKILICNVGEGNLGEDTSQLLGTTIIAKIQQAAMRRVRTKLADRTPFYLFIDEFQNYATTSFTKLLSGGRKFGLRLTIAEQSTEGSPVY